MTARNYTYGLRPPTTNREKVLEQLKLASVYRNRLVEIELQRRAATQQVLLDNCPDLVTCEAALEEVNLQIEQAVAEQKGANQKARGLTDRTLYEHRMAELKPRRKELAAQRKVLRTAAFADGTIQQRLEGVNSAAATDVRAARANCGLYWGTYLQVEQAADSFRKGAPPVFRGYRGEGRIAVQIQKGMTWEEATAGDDTRLRLVHTPQTQQRYTKSGKPLPMSQAKRQGQLYTLWIRVGSDGRDPAWATFPLILHRQPPATARIKWAIVQRIILAGQERWSLTLSLEADAVAFQKPTAKSGMVGIDVGYRILGSGRQRVAYWHGTDGRHGQIVIPADITDQWEKLEDLQSIRDLKFNEAVATLNAWLSENQHHDWLTKETETLHAWKSIGRLARLVKLWRLDDHRFTGDKTIFEALRHWLFGSGKDSDWHGDQHLFQWQENLRDQLLAWRKNAYRNAVCELATQYRTAVVEEMDLREAIHDVQRPEMDRETMTPQRRVARFACLSSLLQFIRERFDETIPVTPDFSTQGHIDCGHRNSSVDFAAHQTVTCDGCGKQYDQDHNAARQLLARGQVVTKSRESLADQAAQGDAPKSEAPRKVSRSQRLAGARKRRSEAKSAKELG